jgi:hypothetical protein
MTFVPTPIPQGATVVAVTLTEDAPPAVDYIFELVSIDGVVQVEEDDLGTVFLEVEDGTDPDDVLNSALAIAYVHDARVTIY